MKDKCVLCGADTPYDVNTHIDRRYYYIEGSGQLCKKCYDEIFEEVKRENYEKAKNKKI